MLATQIQTVELQERREGTGDEPSLAAGRCLAMATS
jgi:hypothetical protein